MDVSRVFKLALACILSALLWAAGVSGALAAEPPKLELKLTMESEVKVVKDGKETVVRTAAEKARQGDTVVYTVTYTNTGKGEAKDASIVDPIPRGMVYVASSAEGKGAEITCSIDGGNTYHKQPVKQTVKTPEGKTEERDAAPSMYTHVKWVVKSVPPGRSGKVSFKATVE